MSIQAAKYKHARLAIALSVACCLKTGLASLDCADQTPLYRTAYHQIAPWFGGITEDNLYAAADHIIRVGHDAFPARKLNLPDFEAESSSYGNIDERLKLSPSEPAFPWATSRYVKLTHVDGVWYVLGGDIPVDEYNDGFNDACNRNFLYDLMTLADKHKLPDLTIIVKSGDTAGVYEPSANGLIPPIFTMFSADHAYDLILPGCINVANPMPIEQWQEEMQKNSVPWKDKLNKAVGRYDMICPRDEVVNRKYQKLPCPRMAVHRLTMSPLNKQLDLLDAGVYAGAERIEHFGPEERQNLARMDMLEQTKYKYTLNLDGLSAAGRLPFLLASDQAVLLVHGSTTSQYFKDALEPWVHFIPTARDDYHDLFPLIQWLNNHTELAEGIAKNGQEFARRHFNERGHLCYTANLLERYAELQRFNPRDHLAKFSSQARPLKDALASFHERTDKFYRARIAAGL